jgi:RNA polymerase sigma factor (sigma-70 family)
VDQNGVAATVRRAAAGDRLAWDRLVEGFGAMVWAVASGYRLGCTDTAEVVQITWLRLVENLDRITQPEAVGAWLATTARREALRQLKLRGREIVTDDESQLGRDDGHELFPSPEAHVLTADRDRRLWDAFERLPDRCRALLRLLMVVEPRYAEVAAALDMPIGSIGPTRARCLGRLRRLLDDDGQTDLAGDA